MIVRCQLLLLPRQITMTISNIYVSNHRQYILGEHRVRRQDNKIYKTMYFHRQPRGALSKSKEHIYVISYP